jgi:hypothetical protein
MLDVKKQEKGSLPKENAINKRHGKVEHLEVWVAS